MKKQLIFLFLTFTIAATAQRETVLDSTYLTNQNGVFFTVRVVNYSTGESEVTSKLVGDTSQLYNGGIRPEPSQTISGLSAITAAGLHN